MDTCDPPHLRRVVTNGHANARTFETAASRKSPIHRGLGRKRDDLSTCVTDEKRVRPGGLEPPTLGSEDRCSVQLSYGRECLIQRPHQD